MKTETALGNGLASISMLDKLLAIADGAVDHWIERARGAGMRADPEAQQVAKEVDNETQKYLALLDVARILEHGVWELSEPERFAELESAMNSMGATFTAILGLLRRYQTGVVAKCEELGFPMVNAPKLDVAIREVERIQSDLLGNWTPFGQEDLEEALIEEAQGMLQDLDDAFVEISGVDKETWQNKVEASKRSKRDGQVGDS